MSADSTSAHNRRHHAASIRQFHGTNNSYEHRNKENDTAPCEPRWYGDPRAPDIYDAKNDHRREKEAALIGNSAGKNSGNSRRPSRCDEIPKLRNQDFGVASATPMFHPPKNPSKLL